ncbi:MAG TPA: glycosyltransferase family 1 protein [Mycobacteriales bacterium]|jgi:alpha-1,3-rhamnosyl/mannosyltransferase|nr:glycosyltransferase family 1 protein [Mycobacteriales bacterium]
MTRLSAGLYIHRLVESATGVQRYAVELAAGLAALDGIDVTLLTGTDETNGRGAAVPVTALAGNGRRRHMQWALLHRPMLEKLVTGYDVVHLVTPAFPLPTRAPLIVTVHDLLPFEHPEWYERGPRWAFGRAISYAADHAVKIIVPSGVVGRQVVELAGVEPDRVVVVPEGVTERVAPSGNAGSPGSSAERPYLLAVGALIERKNLTIVIDALAKLDPHEAPDLMIVGDGEHRAALEQAIESRGLVGRIRLLGRVCDDELVGLLAGALGLVHPALFEGFGLTTVEAMRAGVPVLASTAGSLPEVVGDAGVLLDPRDSDAWASAIQRVASDEDWRRELVARGRDRAVAFTWERAARLTAEVYEAATRR